MAILVVVFGLWMWQVIQQLFMGIPFGTNPAPDLVVVIMGIIPVGILWLIFVLKLETRVDKAGFHYRMWPLQRHFKVFLPGDIASWEVRKYNPLKDYGGWGIRIGFGDRGMAYNIKGNMGAIFHLKSGKRILIGTQRPEELRSALRKMTEPEPYSQNF